MPSLGSSGWTVIDAAQNHSVAAVSVRPGNRSRGLPLVSRYLCKQVAENVGTSANYHAELDSSLPAALTLARADYRLRVMPAPPMPDKEMEEALRWSALTGSDIPMDDADLAWLEIPGQDLLSERPRLLYVVMAQRSLVDARVAAVSKAGITPKVVDIRETGLRNLALKLAQGDEGIALISVDDSGVSMVFTDQGAIFLDRYIEQPLSEWHMADETARRRMLERIAVQVMRSVDYLSRNFAFTAKMRVVVGPTPEPMGLGDYLAEQLPLPVSVLDLGALFDLSRVPGLRDSAANQARCLVALGAALRSSWGRVAA